MKLLYAEDERQLSAAVAEILRMEGYDVDCAYDGEQALAFLQSGLYDAAILDIMMPKTDGITVLQTMRSHADYTPVLMLTAKAAADDRVEGLDTGADDYVGKPFAVKELLAHLRALLRRENAYRDKTLSLGNVCLNCETGELRTDSGSLRLSAKETVLLALFFKHPSVPISEQTIQETLFGNDPSRDNRSPDDRTGDVRSADVWTGDVRSGDVRSADVRPADIRPADEGLRHKKHIEIGKGSFSQNITADEKTLKGSDGSTALYIAYLKNKLRQIHAGIQIDEDKAENNPGFILTISPAAHTLPTG